MVDLGAELPHEGAHVTDEIGPPFLLNATQAAQPVGFELVALILAEEILARHAAALGWS